MPKVTSAQVQKCFHKRKAESHKGENGSVLVIGGSDDYSGAPLLCAISAKVALRAGTDLVFLFAPEKVGWAASRYSPDLIVRKAKGSFFTKKHVKEALLLSEKAGVVAIGNGVGLRPQTVSFVKEFVAKNTKTLVVDADAIKALAGKKFSGSVLLTPHKKELEVFSGEKITNPLLQVKEIAARSNCVILLKGKIDYISDGKTVFTNSTGNSGMTVGGTGDVLAGLCAAFVAHSNSLLDSACAAAYLNGLVGDSLLRNKGLGFIASDFAEEIQFVAKKFWGKTR